MIMQDSDPEQAREDCFGPPIEPCRVQCIHCGEEYSSSKMVWIKEPGTDTGFWCCPVDGCDGKGFGFDIFPVDPEICEEHGIHVGYGDEEDEEGYGDETGEFEDRDAPPEYGPIDNPF